MATIKALLGLFPKTGEYESRRVILKEEYNALLAFEKSDELKAFHELEKEVLSDDFEQRRKQILSLRYKASEDFLKEKTFKGWQKTKEIRTFYKVKDSQELDLFEKTEKSEVLKKYRELEKFIGSTEYAEAKREASLSPRQKFANSDLAETLTQYQEQKKSESIQGYYKFTGNKLFAEYKSALESGLPAKVSDLGKEVLSVEFKDKKASMNKSEFANSDENIRLEKYNNLKKSKTYRNYLKMARSPFKKYYDDLHNSNEIEAFDNLKKFVLSEEFKQQKKEIESRKFKDTSEYKKFKEFTALKSSEEIKFYFKYKKSQGYKIYVDLKGSAKIDDFESLKAYIEADKFIKNKTYLTQNPKKRWQESEEFATLQKYEKAKKSEKIVWFNTNFKAKRFDWLRVWNESFFDDFSTGKLDKKKWLTRYYWGDEMLNDSYSLSQDKHFVTDGKNIEFSKSSLVITTKKENTKGKSWDSEMGFVSREFGYTSGLISTGKSFRQKYGTFEAKIKIHDNKDIQNAFWMVSKTLVPHINIANASKKLTLGNSWGDPKDLKSIGKFTKNLNRSKFAADFFIYTFEWTPDRLSWRINGLEVASSNRGIPEEPMYMVFSAGLQKEMNGITSARMEVDWVRCFQHVDFA